MKHLLLLLSVLVVSACATIEKSDDSLPPYEAPERSEETNVLGDLQRKLGMDRPIDDLGIEEKSFNDCNLGFASRSSGCKEQYLTVIHFQIFCRDSEGTVESVTHSDLAPVVVNSLEWKLGSMTGFTKTDQRGYGQIVAVSSSSKEDEKLILQTGVQYLGVRASEVRKIVVPLSWCTNY